MTAQAPTLTPAQALARIRAAGNKDVTHEGFTYVLDGCMGTPLDAMWPCATGPGEAQWTPTGEPDQPITDADTWVEV